MKFPKEDSSIQPSSQKSGLVLCPATPSEGCLSPTPADSELQILYPISPRSTFLPLMFFSEAKKKKKKGEVGEEIIMTH